MNKHEKCPECGNDQFGTGEFGSYGALRPTNLTSLNSAVEAKLCTNCGLVLELRVKRPERFK